MKMIKRRRRRKGQGRGEETGKRNTRRKWEEKMTNGGWISVSLTGINTSV